jgi:hypothetical protein
MTSKQTAAREDHSPAEIETGRRAGRLLLNSDER